MAHSGSYDGQGVPVLPFKPAPPSSDPPPLPPRATRRSSAPLQSSVPPLPIRPESAKIYDNSERKKSIGQAKEPVLPVMTLSEFGSSYCDHLPLSVTVTSGYYGKNSNMQLSVGEMLYVHAMKTTEVVVAAGYGIEKYAIPIYSSCRLAILYNPHGNMSEVMQGYVFNGVKKLARAEPLPKVVCALTPWNKGERAVQVNEIMIVKGKTGTKALQVFSITRNRTDSLPFDCHSKFTTDPKLLYMYLLDIVDNIPDVFPCQAMMQSDNAMKQLLGTQHLTLIKTLSERSLICSYPGTNERFELSTELPDVTVTTCQNNEAEKSQLYESTKNIIIDYNPAYATLCRDDVAKGAYDTQSAIYASVREGFETKGVSFSTSQEILEQIIQSKAPKHAQMHGTRHENSEQTYASIQGDVGDETDEERMKRSNRTFLKSLSKEMVIRIPRCMGLQQYTEAFQGLTGAAMCLLTEEALERQLGITSRLHQIRIMKIINGEKDIQQLLDQSY